MPKTNTDFWTRKIGANRDRDARTLDRLSDLGWTALVIWECELRDVGWSERLVDFLGPAKPQPGRA